MNPLDERIAALEVREERLRKAIMIVVQSLVAADVAATSMAVSLASKDHDKAAEKLEDVSTHHKTAYEALSHGLFDE